MASAAGWYPDPKSGGQRYFDGKDWTDQTAPGPATPWAGGPPPQQRQKKPLGCFKTVLGLFVLIILIGAISNSCHHDDKTDSSSSSSSTSSPTSEAPATPAGPKMPDRTTFTTNPDGSVTASFAIGDSLTEGMIKDGARFDTIDILKYAQATYPNAPQVEVKGSFAMKDAYGNTKTETVIDLFYDRATLDKINFDGVDKDKIWELRDSGIVYPAFQP